LKTHTSKNEISKTLFAIAAGANDAFHRPGIDPALTINAIKGMVARLRKAGAQVRNL
jgi:hypothetical protein